MRQVKEIMSEPHATVHQDTRLADVVNLLAQTNTGAIPVVDSSNSVLGLINERDLLTNDSYIHLKTLFKLLNEFHFYKKDKSQIQEGLKKIMDLRVSDIMDQSPPTLAPDATIEQAAAMLGDPKNNIILIVGDRGILQGVVRLSDITKFYGISTQNKFSKLGLDKQVDKFMNEFQKEFLLVSAFRTRTWVFTSLLFALVGFSIALMLLININIQF
jgi:CBS domain-containing protein